MYYTRIDLGTKIYPDEVKVCVFAMRSCYSLSLLCKLAEIAIRISAIIYQFPANKF